MLQHIKALPIDPPSFLWKKTEWGKDLKVHEWIHSIHNANEGILKSPDVILLGVPLSRSSISVSGASEFPDSFRRSWNGFTTYNLDEDIDLRGLDVLDTGNVAMHVTNIPLCHQRIKESSYGLSKLYPNSFVASIGGDHSITAMLVSGWAEAHPNDTIGILQFDTHFDLRDIKIDGPTNGTPIRQLLESGRIKGENVYNIGVHGFFNGPTLAEYAKKAGVHFQTMKQARAKGIKAAVQQALSSLADKCDLIYLTVDMDVLDISSAPGVPASTPGGMRTDELLEAVYTAALHPKVKAMDIVCLDPTKDSTVQMTVKTGTHVFLTFMTGLLKRKIKQV